MKTAVVYQRRKDLLIDGMSQTTAGVWISAGRWQRLTLDADDEALGKAVRLALGDSRSGVPHPAREDFPALLQPLLDAAGVKSYNTFEKGAKSVDVAQDDAGVFTVSPTENRGSAGGFVPQAGETVRGVNDAELGRAIHRALSMSR